MFQDRFNVFPIAMAALLHAGFVGSMLVAWDFSRPPKPITPMVITATLVTVDEIPAAPVATPPPPQPAPVVDTPEQDRIAAEEAKRQQDLAAEQARVAREEQAERERQAESDRQRRAEEAERKRQQEAELERKRVEAEQKRQEDIERQRLENERQRRLELQQEEESLRQAEIDAEEARLAARSPQAMAAYAYAIQQKVMRNWARPATARAGISCEVLVRQTRGGDVITVDIGDCNGDAAVRRSIEAAVNKASPLPVPTDPNLFEQNLRFFFEPTE